MGYQTDKALAFSVTPDGLRYSDDAQQAAFMRQVVRGLSEIDGVEATVAVGAKPMDDGLNEEFASPRARRRQPLGPLPLREPGRFRRPRHDPAEGARVRGHRLRGTPGEHHRQPLPRRTLLAGVRTRSGRPSSSRCTTKWARPSELLAWSRMFATKVLQWTVAWRRSTGPPSVPSGEARAGSWCRAQGDPMALVPAIRTFMKRVDPGSAPDRRRTLSDPSWTRSSSLPARTSPDLGPSGRQHPRPRRGRDLRRDGICRLPTQAGNRHSQGSRGPKLAGGTGNRSTGHGAHDVRPGRRSPPDPGCGPRPGEPGLRRLRHRPRVHRVGRRFLRDRSPCRMPDPSFEGGPHESSRRPALRVKVRRPHTPHAAAATGQRFPSAFTSGARFRTARFHKRTDSEAEAPLRTTVTPCS